MTNKKDKLIVALDVPTYNEAEQIVDELKNDVNIFKIGSQLFTACGPKIIDMVHNKGKKVFLDLKFYDIPNTVKNVSKVVSDMGVFMFNVHALGGIKMMKTARSVCNKDTIILAVTILTSMDQKILKSLGISSNLDDQVMHLAKMANQAGLDGVVASVKEASYIRKELGKDFVIVTPGIRLVNADDDQKRVSTPQNAIQAGSSYLVIGRPIIQAKNKPKAAQEILAQMFVVS